MFRDDALLLTYIPNNYSQTTISNSMPPNASELKVTDVPNCPKHDQLCGFEAGMVVIIFDDAGHFDTFEITKVQDDAAHLQHQGYDLNYEFQTGSHITQGSRAGFYRDSTTNQLRKTNGWTGNTPLVDDMVDLKFAYFGDPNPPKYPKPDAGEANCLYDASGNLLPMPVLPLSDGSLSRPDRPHVDRRAFLWRRIEPIRCRPAAHSEDPRHLADAGRLIVAARREHLAVDQPRQISWRRAFGAGLHRHLRDGAA